MFYVSYIEPNGTAIQKIYHNRWSSNLYFTDTFNPHAEGVTLVNFKLSGNTYQARKNALRGLIIDLENAFADFNDLDNIKIGLSYSELADISNYIEEQARRYGLLTEFKQEGVII